MRSPILNFTAVYIAPWKLKTATAARDPTRRVFSVLTGLMRTWIKTALKSTTIWGKRRLPSTVWAIFMPLPCMSRMSVAHW